MFYLGAAVCAAVVFCLVIIVRDSCRFVIVPYKVKSPKIKKEYTFVMLSDLHNRSYGRENEKLIKAIEEISPDCILTAGDMYTSQEGSGYANASALLTALAGRFPVYCANGNHEHKTSQYPELFDHVYERYTSELEQAGIQVLVNERVVLPGVNADICGAQIGRQFFRRLCRRPMPEGYLEGLLGKAQKDRFQILLAHNPDYFPEYAAWGADLVLSGHIHGGIVKLPILGGVLSPSLALFPKYDGGEYRQGRSRMILGRGLGSHTIPLRMWNPAELVVVNLTPETDDTKKALRAGEGIEGE